MSLLSLDLVLFPGSPLLSVESLGTRLVWTAVCTTEDTLR